MTTPRTSRVADRRVVIPTRDVTLDGTLTWPMHPVGVVLFAHGSGSSRLSPRNRHVAATLVDAGLATLLFDLLTEGEAADRRNVFDIPLLARRLLAGVGWVTGQPEVLRRPVGLFGASTGAAAALIAAALAPDRVQAVVSRGGRPDLTGVYLPLVIAPTLLIVGGEDRAVLDLNREGFDRLLCPRELAIVPNATHLFEEPGALKQVAILAASWFTHHLVGSRHPSSTHG